MMTPSAIMRGHAPMHQVCTGSGDPVLFLHGMPTSCHLWDRVIGRLCGHFTCIAVDLPGLGRTPRLSEGFRALNSLAASVERLRIELGIERWHVVGHDAGCAIAVEYAHCYPHRVERLALLTPSIFPDLKPFSLFEVLRKPVVGELMAPAINLLFWKFVMRLALEEDANTNRDRDNIVRDFQTPFHGLTGAWRLMSLLRWGDPAEVLASMPARLTELLAPTLIFHGKQDSAVPVSFAARAASLIPESEVIFLESGHFLPLNEPATVARELLRFFDEHRVKSNTAVDRSRSGLFDQINIAAPSRQATMSPLS
jgi:pimeloyl-ACP methyl ester carboxylesterase